MKRGYDRFFVHLQGEDPTEYIYVNTKRGTIPLRDGGRSFNDTVGFPVRTYRGEGNISMPVVLDDFTMWCGGKLTEIAYADIPKGIKQRYARWEKLQ